MDKPRVYDNGDAYYGEVRADDGERHGQGVYLWSSGTIYEGMWKNGKKEGTGREIKNDGCVWIGQRLNDLSHGLVYAVIYNVH